MQKKQSHFIQNDLIILLTLLICVSLVSIYNAQQLDQYSRNFVILQLIWYIVGIGFVVGLQFLDLDQLYKVSFIVYGVTVFLLIVLWLSPESIARVVNGSKSWFHLPGFTLQPSEFTKIGLIMYLSALISKHKEKVKNVTVKTDLILLGKIIVVTVIPFFFTQLQPDLGTSLVYFFIAGVMLVLSGIDWKILGLLIGTILVVAVGAVFFVLNFPQFSEDTLGIKPYQMDRIRTWFDPTQQSSDETYQIDRSLQALGSGQLNGKGLASLQVKLPEAHTDFIFSVVGESFGFIGSAVVIFLFFLLLYKLVTLGMKVYSYNAFGSYLCFGFMALILMHTFQNIGMTLGIMPITGVPLLFISYGGSSVMSTMLGFGLIYRVAVSYSVQSDYLFK